LAKREVQRIVVALLNWHRLRRAGCDSGQFLGSPYPEEIKVSSASSLAFDVRPAVNYLQSHCSEAISEQVVADLYGISRFRFSREFKRATGTTFKDYVISYRMTMAKSLLERPGVLIADVAAVVGFSDPAYFSRVFKKKFGTPPSEHRAPQFTTSCRSAIEEVRTFS
jgi:AraC-like DNA-binding protein